MGRLAAILPLVVCLFWGASSCDYVSNVNNEANRAYHASRWQATIDSCLSGEPYHAPTTPPVPRVCQELDSLYPGVANNFNTAGVAWDELVYQAELDLAFIAEMLAVLESKNTVSIEQLAPQITGYSEKTDQLEAQWRGSLDHTQQAVSTLTDSWEAIWVVNDLEFELETQIAVRRSQMANQVGELREEALAHYHHTEFSRMAQTYLGYQVVGDEIPLKSHLPQDCTTVADAHNALDAALLVRYSIDKAIERDIELVSRLAKVDLSSQSWDEIKMKKGRYGEKRVSAAIARLKLLKYLDALATDSLGIIIREVGLEWNTVWPGHNLETNIFEFAGVQKVD